MNLLPLAVGLVSLALVSSCSAGDTTPADSDVASLTNAKASSERFLDQQVAAAFVSPGLSSENPEAPGYVVFVGSTGKLSMLKTGPLDGGFVAASPSGRLTYSTTTSDYLLGAGKISARKRGGRQATGHWIGRLNDDDFVRSFNTGGGVDGSYVTDIYWTNGSVQSHSVMPDVPGAFGIVGSTLFSTNSGSSTLDGKVGLYATDLLPEGRTSKALEWTYEGFDEGAYWDEGSDVFAANGRLWFTETLSPPDGKEFFDDGKGEHIQLAEVDVTSGTYVSTPVLAYAEGMLESEDGFSPLAVSASGGHLVNGSIYTIDLEGNILAISLKSKSARTVGKVTSQAITASSAQVHWNANQLAILYTDDSSMGGALATYDLTTGNETGVLPINGLSDLLDSERGMTLWSMTTL